MVRRAFSPRWAAVIALLVLACPSAGCQSAAAPQPPLQPKVVYRASGGAWFLTVEPGSGQSRILVEEHDARGPRKAVVKGVRVDLRQGSAATVVEFPEDMAEPFSLAPGPGGRLARVRWLDDSRDGSVVEVWERDATWRQLLPPGK